MTELPRGRVPAVVTLIVATVGFALALALRAGVDPWRSTAAVAVASALLSAWTLGPRLRVLFAITVRGAAVAVGLGAGLVAATHGGFQLLRSASPELATAVLGLYASVDHGTSRPTLAVLATIIVISEELVWRGVAVAVVGERHSKLAVGAISVVLYVLPQLPGHVAVLIVAATALGGVLAAQRLLTGRVIDPLLTHLIWSGAVFVVFPVS